MKRKAIEEILSKLGSKEFKYTGEWVMTNCPLPPWTHDGGTDSNPSFGVLVKKGLSPANCFACEFSGGMLTLIREYGRYAVDDGRISKESMDELVDYVLLEEEEDVEDGDRLILEEDPMLSEEIVDCLGKWHEYFEYRGISREGQDVWGLGYSSTEGRILFPVYDQSGIAPIGVVGRTVRNEDPKYKNYPRGFKRGEYLLGEHLIPKKGVEKLIVVEGPIDAVKVWQKIDEEELSGFSVVAGLGTKMTETQIEKLVWYANEEIVLMLDNDPSGIKGTQKVNEVVGERKPVFIVEYPEDVKEPEDLIELGPVLENRISYLEYKMKRILGGVDGLFGY